MWYLQRYRHRDQWDRIKSQETFHTNKPNWFWHRCKKHFNGEKLLYILTCKYFCLIYPKIDQCLISHYSTTCYQQYLFSSPHIIYYLMAIAPVFSATSLKSIIFIMKSLLALPPHQLELLIPPKWSTSHLLFPYILFSILFFFLLATTGIDLCLLQLNVNYRR